MTYGVVLGIALLHVGFMLSILCYWLAARAVAPGLVDWAESRYRERPLRVLMGGALVAAPLLIVAIVLTKVPIPGANQIGGGLLFGMLLLGLVGSAGLAQHIGRGLHSPTDQAQPWRGVLRGGGVLLFTMIMPILGWFILLPMMLASGIGACLGYLRRPKVVAPEAVEAAA